MELLSESSNVMLGKAAADGNLVTLQGNRVLATQCDEVQVIIHLSTGAAATAAQQATVTVEEHTLNAGGTTQTITQETTVLTNGAPLMVNGTGIAARTKNTTPQSSYQTLAADGNKEQILIIPIRSRRLSSGFRYLSAKVTGLTAARVVAIYMQRTGESYGAEQNVNLY